MVFRNQGRRSWKARVRHPDGRVKVCGCDTEQRSTAKAMEGWAKQLYQDRTVEGLAVLDAIVAGRLTLPRAFDHRNDLKALIRDADDTNIEPLVELWRAAKSKSRKGAASAEKYEQQVRSLIHKAKPFPRSRFTAATVRAHLKALPHLEEPSRNRYKAAFSSFADYLVDEGQLDRNPVRDVKGWSEGEGRVVYYERDQAQALIAALPQPFQAIEALMVGAGLEWQAIEAMKARDVDLDAMEVTAHGGKTRWRNRRCRIVEDWTAPFIKPALAGKFDNQPVFSVTRFMAYKAHAAAVKAIGLPHSTLHDWRHTHAVLMLRSGYKPTVVAHQLGHRDTNLVWKRYGRFAVDSRDYVLPVTQAVTAPEKLREAK
jgi:integrase